MLTNLLFLGCMITMAVVGYTSAYTVMKKELVMKDIQLHMAYTYIGDKLDDAKRNDRVYET